MNKFNKYRIQKKIKLQYQKKIINNKRMIIKNNKYNKNLNNNNKMMKSNKNKIKKLININQMVY